MITSSPGSSSTWYALYNDCLPPLETTISSGRYCSPLSRSSFSQMALRSSRVPAAGVYLVSPCWMAAMPAALIDSGVSKSGSPTEKLTTSMPSAAICFDRASIAMVGDGVRILARADRRMVSHSSRSGLFPGYANLSRQYTPYLQHCKAVK